MTLQSKIIISVFVLRLTTGQPTVTKRPPVSQKWRRNVQQGGGAYIPCEWIIRCSGAVVEEVKERIVRAISELGEEGAEMDVEVFRNSIRFYDLPKMKIILFTNICLVF